MGRKVPRLDLPAVDDLLTVSYTHLIAQVTNEDEIRNMINHGKATFYIGFD